MKQWMLVWLLMCVGAAVFGTGITENEARIVAVNWLNLKSNYNYSKENIQTVYTRTAGDTLLMYIVAMEPQGWVMVSGTEKVEPVLGYSTNSEFNIQLLPVQMNEWIDGIQQEIIHSLRPGYLPDQSLNQKWAQIKSDHQAPVLLKSATISAGPLLSCTWDQGKYYNEMAPYDASSSAGNNHTWIGCVATAMAQLMKYWEYPTQGTGSYSYTHNEYGLQSANFGESTYNWGAMSNHLSAENTEVQKICYHVAVSVHMDFDPKGSGAYLEDAQASFINFFNYNSTIFEPSKADWDETQWKNQLKNEINKGRPVIYAGYNAAGYSGHAFVCDGYTDDYFHFNWGWGGNANGNFLLSLLNPAGTNYSYNQAALMGIEPIVSSPIESPYFEGFESAATGYFSTMGVSNVVSTERHSGSYSLQLSQSSFSSYSKNCASLSFLVPGDGHLSFWVKRSTPVNSNFNQQSASILTQYGETELVTFFSGDFQDEDWVNYSIDLSAFGGQFVRLMFTQQNFDVVKEQWMYIDDIVISGIGQNMAPFTPSLPVPDNGTTGISLTPQLHWSGGDPNGDFVRYSVYFGKTQTPPFVATASENKFSPGRLDRSSTYFWRIVADDGQTQTEGPLWSFVTRDLPPDMAICGISNIGNNSASICGEIVNYNNSTVTERGICWRAAPNASIADYKITSAQSTSTFSCELTNLLPYRNYYFKAYALSSEGVAYSEEQSFITLPDLPNVDYGAVSDIRRTSAMVRGIVSNNNDIAILSRGVVWYESKNIGPEDYNSITENGQWTVPDSFDVELTDLPGPATIYFRIFAENSVGIAYSEEDSFVTFNTAPVIDLDADNSSSVANNLFSTWVTEQELDGYVADTDLLISDVDDDPIIKVTLVLQKQSINENEYLLFIEDPTNVQVTGNGTDTLLVESSTTLSHDQWTAIIRKAVIYIDEDAPDVELVREVSVVLNDGFDDSEPVKALFTVIPANDSPINLQLPAITGEPGLNAIVGVNAGLWDDAADQVNCNFEFHYQWQVMRNGLVVDIEEQTEKQFFIDMEYCGDSIRIIETVVDSNCGGNESISSSIASEWLVVEKTAQTVSVDQLPVMAYTKIPFTMRGEASSGLPLTYSMAANAVAHLSNDTIYIDAVGRTVVSAIQPGNECYLPFGPVYRILTVESGTQEIICNNPGNVSYSIGKLAVFAESSAGLPLGIISSDSTIAYVFNDTIFLSNTGTVQFTFAQEGNEYITAAEPIVATLIVEKGQQLLSANVENVYHYGDENVDLGIEVSSRLEPIVEISNSGVLQFIDGQLEIIGVGDCVLTLSQPGNENYYPATEVVLNINVVKGIQQINLEIEDEVRYGLTELSYTLNASSGLPMEISSTDTSIIKVKDDQLQIAGVGQTILKVFNSGNEFWNETSLEKSIHVLKGIQKIQATDSLVKHYGDADFELLVNVEAGEANYEVEVQNQEILIQQNGLFHITGVGQTKVTIIQSGTERWEPFEKSLNIEVLKGISILTFDSIKQATFGDEPLILHGSSNTGLVINYESSNPEIAVVNGNELIIRNAGQSTITAVQPGNDLWADAASISRWLMVNKGSQKITTTLSDTLTLTDVVLFSDFQTTSGLPVDQVISSNTSVISVNSNVISIESSGSVTLTAYQSGNQNVDEATAVFNFEVIEGVFVPEYLNIAWSVFPNPAHGKLNLNVAHEIDLPLTLRIVNATGQEVLDVYIESQNQLIDISNVFPGIYLVKLNSQNKEKIVKLLVE